MYRRIISGLLVVTAIAYAYPISDIEDFQNPLSAICPECYDSRHEDAFSGPRGLTTGGGGAGTGGGGRLSALKAFTPQRHHAAWTYFTPSKSQVSEYIDNWLNPSVYRSKRFPPMWRSPPINNYYSQFTQEKRRKRRSSKRAGKRGNDKLDKRSTAFRLAQLKRHLGSLMRHGGPWEGDGGRLATVSHGNGRHSNVHSNAALPSQTGQLTGDVDGGEDDDAVADTESLLQEALVTLLRHPMEAEGGRGVDTKGGVIKGKQVVVKTARVPIAGAGYDRRPNMNRWWMNMPGKPMLKQNNLDARQNIRHVINSDPKHPSNPLPRPHNVW